MGFWHTGYMEFHEPVGLGDGYPPPPPIFACQHCGEEFPNADDLRSHRFETHPFSRPVLLVRGLEVGSSPLIISRRFGPADIETLKCEKAVLNGDEVPPQQLGLNLSKLGNGSVKIELSNGRVSASFDLLVRVADEADVIGVERSFLNVARHRRLDMRSVEDFIDSGQTFASAADYLDGICEYFYGVLAKEHAADSSLPYELYRTKFSRSADKLKDFRRPLANTIQALIDFQFNHFFEAEALAPGFRVGLASQRFGKWIVGELEAARAIPHSSFDTELESLLTDLETERILRWSVESSDQIVRQADKIEAFLLTDVPEYDRTKLHIVLAESYAERGRPNRFFISSRAACRGDSHT